MTRRRVTFLDQLTPMNRSVIVALGRRREYARGQVIYRQGQLAGRLLIVMHGCAVLQADVPDRGNGHKLALIGAAFSGQLLGDTETLGAAPTRYRHTAFAVRDTEVLEISPQHFLEYAAQDPWVWRSAYLDSQDRRAAAEFWIAKLATAWVPERLARVLLYLFDPAEVTATGRYTVWLDNKQLAGWIGTCPRTVRRALTQWAKRGCIIIGDKHLTITKHRELREIANIPVPPRPVPRPATAPTRRRVRKTGEPPRARKTA